MSRCERVRNVGHSLKPGVYRMKRDLTCYVALDGNDIDVPAGTLVKLVDTWTVGGPDLTSCVFQMESGTRFVLLDILSVHYVEHVTPLGLLADQAE